MIQVSHSVDTRIRLLLVPQDIETATKHHPLSDVQGHTGAQDPCSADEECCVSPFPFLPIRTGSPLETKSAALPLRNMYLNHCATIS